MSKEDVPVDYDLAVSVGYPESKIKILNTGVFVEVLDTKPRGNGLHYKRFSYKDPLVIWPLAERYRCFPSPFVDNNGKVIAWEAHVYSEKTGKCLKLVKHDTSQLASAMAVIASVAS